MCGENDPVGVFNVEPVMDGGASEPWWSLLKASPSIDEYANYLATLAQEFLEYASRNQVGFVAYGPIKPGDRVLIAVSTLYDMEFVAALRRALKAKGAEVDVLIIDEGENRELNYDDEIRLIIRRRPWWVEPRWYDYREDVANFARENGYVLVIHGKGGPIPRTNHRGERLPRIEAIPWMTKEQFLSRATVFPPKLNYLINIKTWRLIYNEGRGGRVRMTDPEGTELEFTLHEKYYDRALDERGGFGPRPVLGHLFGHPTPPIIPEEDAVGVVAGTTSHLARPFPRVKVYIENGRVEKIEGGGGYGDAWKALLEETSGIQYPEFPGPGLFWLWEMAIGTNPKVRRPRDVLMLSGTNEKERSRSGVIHVGFGTRWRGPSEVWAAERGLPYGHLHVHLLFPTYVIRRDGNDIVVIENGHLKALDDPEVRDLARKYGDPDELLREDWVPKVPGITIPGDYEEYARDPYTWIKRYIEEHGEPP